MTTHTNTTGTAADRAADPQINILETGYTPAILDGQIVAAPLHPGIATTEFVPAIVNGEAVAVPVHNPLAVPAAEPQPAAPMQTVADPGLPLAVRQYVLYGSIASLAAGGAVWMLGAAVAEVAPHADQIGEVLKWVAIVVAVLVLGAAGLLGKLRAVATGTASGTRVAATGDGASATGTVVALVHRTHQTHIGKQSAGWRGSITNNNG